MNEERTLARLEMKLTTSENLSFKMSSLFHGALMERLSEEYCEFLHTSKLHPFTQHLERKNDEWIWIVTTLDDQAKEEIITKTLKNLYEFELKRQNILVRISDRSYTEISERVLLTDFYNEQSSNYVNVHFITPVSFKRKGKYLIYPDMFCIFQSLMNKYDNSSSAYEMVDPDTLEQIYNASEIIRYNLKSTIFELEGVKIPSFTGWMTVRIAGNQNIKNFIHLLFKFGEYSGVGIKTALGMGAIEINRERSNTGDR